MWPYTPHTYTRTQTPSSVWEKRFPASFVPQPAENHTYHSQSISSHLSVILTCLAFLNLLWTAINVHWFASYFHNIFNTQDKGWSCSVKYIPFPYKLMNISNSLFPYLPSSGLFNSSSWDLDELAGSGNSEIEENEYQPELFDPVILRSGTLATTWQSRFLVRN